MSVIHATQGVSDLLRPIVAELRERLDDELSYNDALALETAVSKAACAAYRAGIADLVMALREESVPLPRIYFAEHEPDPDPWAEEFGE